MLWYKGWLETRFRLLFALGLVAFFLISAHTKEFKSPAGLKMFVGTAWLIVATFSGMVAGAGIATQPSLQATKGIHGSTLFTLALPVSRLRLLVVRSSLGWLEMAGGIAALCVGMWILFPFLRGASTPEEMIQHAVALIACGTGLYFIPVLLATFLDDQWRVWGSMIAFGALWWLSSNTPLPASVNIFRATAEASPLLAHTMPWTAMAFSLGLAAILFFAALRVVRSREY